MRRSPSRSKAQSDQRYQGDDGTRWREGHQEDEAAMESSCREDVGKTGSAN